MTDQPSPDTTPINPPTDVKPNVKPKRKSRVLTEEQRKTMLANLALGRQKAHDMRREMEAKRKSDKEQPTPEPIPQNKLEPTPDPPQRQRGSEDPNKLEPTDPTPLKPAIVFKKRPVRKQREIIYEQEETDSDNTETPVVVRRVRKNKSPPPPPPPTLKREPSVAELKMRERIQKEEQLKRTLSNFFI